MQQRGKTNTSNAVLPNPNAAVCSNRHLFQLDVWHSFWVSLCYQLLVWSFQCIGLHTFHKSPLGEAPSSRRHKPRPHSSHPRHATTSHLLEHSFASHHHDKNANSYNPHPLLCSTVKFPVCLKISSCQSLFLAAGGKQTVYDIRQ